MSGVAPAPAAPLRRGLDRRVWIRSGAVLLLLGLVIAFRRSLHLGEHFSRENIGATIGAIQAWVGQFGFWGPVVFTLAGAVTAILYCPVVLVVFIAVTLFGKLWGGVASFVIVALGSSLVHGIAHGLGRPLVERMFGSRMRKMEEKFARRELLNVIMLRLVLIMNPLLNWALGISGVRFRNVLIGTVVGCAPAILLLVWMSAELIDFATGSGSLNLLKHPELLIPLVLAVVLFRSRWFFDRFDRMRGAAEPAGSAEQP